MLKATTLSPSHKPQSRDADSDMRGKDLAQSSEACSKGAAGSEDVIQKDDMPDGTAVFEYDCSVLPD